MSNARTSQLPIMIVEDDSDDIAMLTDALTAIGVKNKCICFESASEALDYLVTGNEYPLLIISDINMPFMNGLDFKKKINANEKLDKKKIPFVFLTTADSETLVNEAFQLSVQGYFKKPVEFSELNGVAHSIVDYWNKSRLPN